MKLKSRNIIKMIVGLLIVLGLLHVYFSTLNNRFQGSVSRRKMQEAAETILKYPKKSNRLLCNSIVYLDTEEKVKDENWNMKVLHDFEHKRMQTIAGKRSEIYEYGADELHVYTKGVSPVFIKEEVQLKKLPPDRWFKYSCEPLYGQGRKAGTTHRTSYGYLGSLEHMKRLYHDDDEEIDGVKYEKYIAEIWNTNKLNEPFKEGDNEFRKALSANGLDVMKLRNNYPEVYKLLKELYQKETEKLSVWIDPDGKLAFLEKDYTFQYYMNVMKENSEIIHMKVCRHGYPRVICRQTYTYSPNCEDIQIPKEFEEI